MRDNSQERRDRYAVEDEHWRMNFTQAVSQFAESMKLDYAKLDMTRAQFAEGVRQWWTQFNAQQDQLGRDNAFREKQLEQSAKQFAQSLGLDKEKFVEAVRQFDATLGYQKEQDKKTWAWREQDRADTLKQQDFSNNVTLRQLANSEEQQRLNNDITFRQLENAENQQRITNARAARQDADSQAQAARNRLATTGQALLNAGVSIANSPDMLDALGMTAEQSELYRSAATQGLVSSGSKSSGTGGTSGGASGTARGAEALFEAASASGTPSNFIASNYKKFGFTTSSGLMTQYNAWAKDENNLMTNGPSKNTATVTGTGQDAKVTVNKGTGTPGGTVPFNYDPEEGIVTVNGKSFSSGRDFTNYMQTLNLSREQWISLYNRMGLYGTAFQSVREQLARELGLS